MLGLRLCARAFSSCGERRPLFIAMHGPLTIAASLVAEHRLQTRRLSSCGPRAQPLRGMWDPPRPGLEPVSPALAGRFSTTVPPGKPDFGYLSDIGIQTLMLKPDRFLWVVQYIGLCNSPTTYQVIPLLQEEGLEKIVNDGGGYGNEWLLWNWWQL